MLQEKELGFDLARRVTSEGLGAALLLAIVVGSGIMAERLSGGNDAIALLGNTLATGAGLVVLITIFGPLSGAHFNPVVTAVFAFRREIGWREASAYALAQVAGAIIGVWCAHLMFGERVLQLSSKLRDGPGQAFAEGVATFGLVAVILGGLRFRRESVPILVGLYVASAYWFTASTSFANPTVTLARMLTDSFAGIAPPSVPGFLMGQVAGAAVAAVLSSWLFKRTHGA